MTLFNKKLTVSVAILALVVSGAMFIGFGHASADTFVNSNPTDNFPVGTSVNDQWILLSQYQCPGHCLETDHAEVKVFFKTSQLDANGIGSSTKLDVYVQRLCRYVGSAGSSVSITGGDSLSSGWITDCNTFNSKSGMATLQVKRSDLNPGGAKFPGYEYATVSMQVNTNSGNQPVVGAWISVDTGMGTKVVAAEDPDPYTPYDNSNCYTGGNGACSPDGKGAQTPTKNKRMALWSNYNNQSTTTPTDNFSMGFATACDETTNQTVYLRWYDADASSGGNGTQAANLSFDLVDDNGTVIINNYGASNASLLGGDESYRDVSFTAKPGHSYKWIWHNVSPTNGIQIWMPYSEMGNAVNCSKPPTGNLTLSCVNNNWIWSATNVQDPDRTSDGSLDYKLMHDIPSGGTGLNGYIDAGPATTLNHAASGAKQLSARKYRLYIMDINAGGSNTGDWTQVDSQTLTSTDITNCGGQPPCGADNDTNVFTPPPGCSASCTINSITGSGPGGIVLDGDHPTINITILNTGTKNLPAYVNQGGANRPISILDYDDKGTAATTDDYSHIYHVTDYVGFDLDPGESMSFSATSDKTASWSQGVYSFHGTPIYDGAYFLWPGGWCGGNTTAIPYRHFNIDPHANLNGDSENPTTINYTTGGNKTEGPDVNVTDTSWLQYAPYGGGFSTVDGNHNTPRTYGAPPDESFNYNPPSIKSGDQYCAHVVISPANGYVDVNGGMVYTNAVQADSPCIRVNNKPYVHAINSDVSAGGGFGKSCTKVSAGIKTYTKSSGVQQPGGSGVQIGALSIGSIYGFNSANLRSVAPDSSTEGLTFANTGIAAPGGVAPYLGGDLGDNHCVNDYFSLKPDDTPNNGGGFLDLSTLDGPNYYSGDVTLNSAGDASIANGKNIAIYVDGDVTIKHGVKYANATAAGGYGGIENIPSVYVVARGNIYIDPGVSQLDGMYVAQPTDAAGNNKGIIYTCAASKTPYDDPSMLGSWLGNCRRQLVVNGSFVAQHIHLLRTFGSIRDSGQYPGEHLFGRPSLTCSDSGNTSLGDCAAEIFNLTPELYLSQPAITPTTGPTTGTYQYITSLSPVL